MTPTYHFRAFVALPAFVTEQGDAGQQMARQQIADLYLGAELIGITITEGMGYTTEWGAEPTLIVESYSANPEDGDRFLSATRKALVALSQQCALVDDTGRAYLLNADGSTSDL